ncbi:MAG: DUF3606 domain-containing protein [Aquabacterium sp.]
MTTSSGSQVGPDRIRIDLEADWEVAYWTRKLSITREQLAQAIAQVGDKAHDIVVHFRQQELAAQPTQAQQQQQQQVQQMQQAQIQPRRPRRHLFEMAD